MDLWYLILVIFTWMGPSVGQNSIETNECGPGLVPGLYGDCIKKFVPPKFKACSEPKLQFGNYELKASGRIAQLWCEDGWSLFPASKTILCKLGEWSAEIPKCVRPGCSERLLSGYPQEDEVIHSEELRGAVVRFQCQRLNMQLVGDPVIVCDGDRWNSTNVPTCVPISETSTATTTVPRRSDDSVQKEEGDNEKLTSGASRNYLNLILIVTFLLK